LEKEETILIRERTASKAHVSATRLTRSCTSTVQHCQPVALHRRSSSRISFMAWGAGFINTDCALLACKRIINSDRVEDVKRIQCHVAVQLKKFWNATTNTEAESPSAKRVLSVDDERRTRRRRDASLLAPSRKQAAAASYSVVQVLVVVVSAGGRLETTGRCCRLGATSDPAFWKLEIISKTARLL